MNTPVYINSASCISPQATFDNEDFLHGKAAFDQVPRRCIEPVYKEYLNPRSLRRMGRMVRMGVCAAHKALQDGQVENPDAILVGTGMGCLHDTEAFLTSIYESDENIASPNQFIQSTHNNVAAQIAMMQSCYNYNFTYVHRGFSFESAMLDAVLHIQEANGNKKNILVGASDELTHMYLEVTSKLNFWKPAAPKKNTLFDLGEGSEQGEGAAFFTLSNECIDQTIAELEDLEMIYKPTDSQELKLKLDKFLNRNQIKLSDIDVVMLGYDGSNDEKSPFRKLVNEVFVDSNCAMFKHLCGEYKTAGAFGTWLVTEMMKKQFVPDFVKMTDFSVSKINRVLLFNNYNNSNFSLSLLSHV